MGNTRKKSLKNIIYGILGQLLTMALGVLIPRLVIVNYGSETNGLISSVSQIFAYVSLLETGVGGATLQALYQPVAINDKAAISSIMSATHNYYRRTGIWYFIAVCLTAVLYPCILVSELGYLSVFGVVMFNGLGGVINYFFQGKYTLLLQAEGKNYITTNLQTIVHTVSSIAKIVLLLLGFDIVVLQFAFFTFSVLQMLYIVAYIKKHYTWIDVNAQPDYKAISQKNSVMVHQLSALVFGNTDVLILTLFCGLKVASVYTLYGLIIGMVDNLLGHYSGGVLFALGQSFSADRVRFDKLLEMFEISYYAIETTFIAIIFVFLNPFLSLYTVGVTDIQYVDRYLPSLFSILYLLKWSRVPSMYVVINIGGFFKQTQKQSILESAINISVSLVGVKIFGIYGVLIGTIVALLYRTNEMIIYANRKILFRSCFNTYKKIVFNIIIIASMAGVWGLALPPINNYIQLLLWAIAMSASVAFVSIIANLILNKNTIFKIFRNLKKTIYAKTLM